MFENKKEGVDMKNIKWLIIAVLLVAICQSANSKTITVVEMEQITSIAPKGAIVPVVRMKLIYDNENQGPGCQFVGFYLSAGSIFDETNHTIYPPPVERFWLIDEGHNGFPPLLLGKINPPLINNIPIYPGTNIVEIYGEVPSGDLLTYHGRSLFFSVGGIFLVNLTEKAEPVTITGTYPIIGSRHVVDNNVTIGSFGIVENENVYRSQVETNVPNQILGSFEIFVSGESVVAKFPSINFESQENDVSKITSISILDENSNTLSGPVNIRSYRTYCDFKDMITFKPGTNRYTVVGKIGGEFPKGSEITVRLEPKREMSMGYISWLGRGQTYNCILQGQINNSIIGMVEVGKRTAKLKVSVDTDWTQKEIFSGSSPVRIGKYTLDATKSSEDIQVLSLPVIFKSISEGDNAINPTKITGCMVVTESAGGRVLNYIVDASNNLNKFVFSYSFVLKKDCSTDLLLWANISSNTPTGVFSMGLSTVTTDYDLFGTTSSNKITVDFGITDGKEITILGCTESFRKLLKFQMNTKKTCELGFLLNMIPGLSYQIETSDDLIHWEFFDKIPSAPTLSATNIAIEINPTKQKKFYRTLCIPDQYSW